MEVGEKVEGQTDIDVANLSDEALGMVSEFEAEYAGGEEEGAPEGDDVKATPAPEEGAEADKVETLEDIKAERDRLREETTKQKELREQQELFIQRRNTEIGDLRKQSNAMQEELNTLKAVDPADYLGDPIAAAEAVARKNALEAGIANTEQTARWQENDVSIRTFVPDVESLAGKMADLLLQDSNDHQNLAETIRANPAVLRSLDPGMVVNLALRAKQIEELSAMRTENAALKAKLSGNSREVVKKIADAANKTPKLTGKVYGESSVDGELALTEEQIANLSDEDLDRIP
jgi:hypothetical protein